MTASGRDWTRGFRSSPQDVSCCISTLSFGYKDWCVPRLLRQGYPRPSAQSLALEQLHKPLHEDPHACTEVPIGRVNDMDRVRLQRPVLQQMHLLGDRVDCVIRGGALNDPSLIARRLGSLKFVTCATPEYLAIHGTPSHPTDLETNHQRVRYFFAGTNRRLQLYVCGSCWMRRRGE